VYVIGTAGHVDHGKSTLVQALSGINPDRLREERERQMTIDLGFAWLTLPSGTEVSVVDVPGHEDFLKNMLAGVGGIDVALLVVAADEAVMPQTREHLAIIDLLRIPRGVIALTKVDLVEDEEWLDLVTEEVRELARGTVLGGAAIIPVSAVTGQGLPELVAELDRLTAQTSPRRDIGRPRLPIDRVFTIAGFGTVVTGTLSDGAFSVGDEVAVVPGEVTARIRGLQTHKTKVERVEPGYRVAMNLGRVATEDLSRGQVVTLPGTIRPTVLLDARLETVEGVPRPVEHNMSVELYVGAARTEAIVRLLDADALGPGETGLVQFRLAAPLVAARGDRYIVRLASPSLTLGGGEVLNAHPGRRHRRRHPEVIASLEALETGDPREILAHLLGPRQALGVGEVIAMSDLPPGEALDALRALVGEGRIVLLAAQPEGLDAPGARDLGLASRAAWEALVARATEALAAYHARYPLRAGMPREELKSRLGLDTPIFGGLLARAEAEGLVRLTPTAVALREHRAALAPAQQASVERLLEAFRRAPYTPPSLAQAEEEVGAEVLEYLLESGVLVKVNDEVVFSAEARDEMERRTVEFLRAHGQATVAEVRDLFDTSRKYALGFLEDLDRRRVTKRLGDARILR
jgi:selenocysteine-specific elongation factor